MFTLTKPSRITVLGAGLMGRLLALSLARQGHQVEVFDAHGPSADGAAAPVAAAMLAPLAESAVTEPNVVRMGQHSLERWPQLLHSLATPVYFQRNGTLIVWHRQDGPEAQRLAGLFDKNTTSTPACRAPSNSMPSAWPPLSLRCKGAFRRASCCRTRASWTTASCCPPWWPNCTPWAWPCTGTAPKS